MKSPAKASQRIKFFSIQTYISKISNSPEIFIKNIKRNVNPISAYTYMQPISAFAAYIKYAAR